MGVVRTHAMFRHENSQDMADKGAENVDCWKIQDGLRTRSDV